MSFTVTILTRGESGLRAREFRTVNKAAMEEALDSWHRNFLPEHFEPSANARYGYQPRKGDNEGPTVTWRREVGGSTRTYTRKNPAYSWRKRRQKGHNKPLVWSGQLQRQAQRMATLRVMADGKRGWVAMSVPKYTFYYNPGEPKRYEELVRWTPKEIEALAFVIRDQQVMGIRRHNELRRKVIK